MGETWDREDTLLFSLPKKTCNTAVPLQLAPTMQVHYGATLNKSLNKMNVGQLNCKICHHKTTCVHETSTTIKTVENQWPDTARKKQLLESSSLPFFTLMANV